MSFVIDNVKKGVTKEEIMRVLRQAGMIKDSTPVKPTPEHEEFFMGHSDLMSHSDFRRYVSDW